MQIVVDDRIGDRRAGDVNDACARETEQEKKAKQPLLVVMDARDPGHHLAVEGDARDDDDGARRGRIAEDFRECGAKPLLEGSRAGEFLRAESYGVRLTQGLAPIFRLTTRPTHYLEKLTGLHTRIKQSRLTLSQSL